MSWIVCVVALSTMATLSRDNAATSAGYATPVSKLPSPRNLEADTLPRVVKPSLINALPEICKLDFNKLSSVRPIPRLAFSVSMIRFDEGPTNLTLSVL